MYRDSYDAVILSGGLSKRFGADKCEFCISGKRMIDRVSEVFDRPIVVSHVDRKLRVDHVFVEDRERKGPAFALKLAVPFLKREKVFVTGCDFPFIKKGVVDLICSKDSDAALPIADEPQPLLGCYKTELIRNGDFKRLIDLIELASSVYFVGTEEIAFVDPGLTSLVNVNTLTDLHKRCRAFTKSRIIFRWGKSVSR